MGRQHECREGFKVDEIGHGGQSAKVANALISYLQEAYDQKESQIGPALMAGLAQNIMMRAIDMRWMLHFREMDCLKAGIGLRAVGKRGPLVEYKEEAYAAFGRMTDAMYEDFLRILLRSKLTFEVKVAQPAA